MPSFDVPMAIIATVLSLGGLAVLYLAWRRPGRSVPLRVLGWGLLAVSAWPWASAGGADRGPAIAMVVVSMAALLVIGITGQWRGAPARRRREASPAAEPAGASGWGHWGLVVLVAGPLAAAAAFALGLLVMHVGGWAEANRLVSAAFAIVILWSAAAVWVCATPHLMRATATLAGLTAAGAVVLLVL